MKTVLFTMILTLGLLANASELECSARITNQNNGMTSEQTIEITATNAIDFKAEAGEVLVGDLKLAVYRNITGGSTNLSVSKKMIA